MLLIYKKKNFSQVKFPCELCEYVGNGKSALRHHRKTKHPETLQNKDEVYQRFQAKVGTHIDAFAILRLIRCKHVLRGAIGAQR